MLSKHLLDRYHIYYLYSTTQVINANIHQNAILFVLISFFFTFLQLTTYTNTRNEFSLTFKPSNICIIILLSYIMFLLFVCFNFDSFSSRSDNNNNNNNQSTQ